MTPAIFGLSGPVMTDDERDFFRDANPAGYILFARNVENRAQLRALTDSLREIHGRERLLVSIDQEGGRVARMRPPEWGSYPSGEAFAKLWRVAPASAIEAARANAEALGLDLAEAGITVDYWPVLDVREPYSHDVVGDRALGSEPMKVAALGRAILDGLARAGVVGCIKHMPGHGRAQVDSHKELPIIEASEDELEIDIEPFRTLRDAPIGMTAASNGPYRRCSRNSGVWAVSPAINSRFPSRSTTKPVQPRYVSRPSRAPQWFTSKALTVAAPTRTVSPQPSSCTE